MSELSEAQIAEFHAAWEAAQGGRSRLLTPLPMRVRLRLRWQRTATTAGVWLCDHGLEGAAVALWRAFRMWS